MGKNVPRTRKRYRMMEDVTRVRDQFFTKATTTAATIVELYSTKIPSFSDIPSCRTLAVEVIVPVA
jgi:hypothetical protein